LAFELGISVQTVSRAYDELIRVGTISVQVSLFPKLVFTYKTAVQVFH
jgi:DNA-binding transcriptional regulator YhcF (GntR family)